MSKEYHISIPTSEQEMRKLEIGDIVYLNGMVLTMRDMGHRRTLDMLEKGDELPFNLKDGALWHCGPVVRKLDDGSYEVTAAGPTTSSRFTFLGAELIERLHVRITVGKGTLGPRAMNAMKEVGAVYLNATGGCAAVYAKQVRKLEKVVWEDLGLPEAIWHFNMEEFGPLIVGIDSHGNNLLENTLSIMQENIKKSCRELGVLEEHNYAYLPKRVPGYYPADVKKE